MNENFVITYCVIVNPIINPKMKVNRITASITPLDLFADFTFAGVKTHKIGCVAKRIGPAVHLLVSSAEV